MDELRLEFEKLLWYKPHHKMWEAKLRATIEAYKSKHPVVVVEAPPIDPMVITPTVDSPAGWIKPDIMIVDDPNIAFDPTGWEVPASTFENIDPIVKSEDVPVTTMETIDTRTPEQIEADIIKEAMWTVQEFIPEPEKMVITEEVAKEMQETVSDNPLMAAMTLLLQSNMKTNELLQQMNEKMAGTWPIKDVITPTEALENLTKAQQDAPLATLKRYKVQILKMDLQATDGWQDRSESGQIFNSEEEATEFGKKYAPLLTPNGLPRYRIYHESIVLPSNREDEK